MRWHTIGSIQIRSDEAAGIWAEITTLTSAETRPFSVAVWRTIDGEDHQPDRALVSGKRCATLDDAKAAALDLMRAEVIAARGEAENLVLDASRWLRENGGEP